SVGDDPREETSLPRLPEEDDQDDPGGDPHTGRVRLRLGCGTGAAIPHLPDTWPEAVVVGLDRTHRTVALGPRAFRGSSATRFGFRSRDRSSTPIGSMPWQSARLHASVAATSSENG